MHFVLLRQAESQTRDVVSMRRDSTVQTQPESLRQTYQDMVDPIVDDSQPFQRSESAEEEILTRCSVALWRSWLHCGTRVCKSWFLGGWFAFSARCACRTRCLCGVRKTSGSVSFFTFEFSPHQVWFVHELWNCTEIASGQIWTCSRTDMGEMRKLLGQRQWWQAIMLAWSSLAWRCSTVCFEASSKVETRSSMAITAWTANEEMKKKSLVLMDLRDRSDTYTNRWLEM